MEISPAQDRIPNYTRKRWLLERRHITKNGCWELLTEGGHISSPYRLVHFPEILPRSCGVHVMAAILWLGHTVHYPPRRPRSGNNIVLHKCPGGPNKRCWNPRHLKVGTYRENWEDAHPGEFDPRSGGDEEYHDFSRKPKRDGRLLMPRRTV